MIILCYFLVVVVTIRKHLRKLCHKEKCLFWLMVLEVNNHLGMSVHVYLSVSHSVLLIYLSTPPFNSLYYCTNIIGSGMPYSDLCGFPSQFKATPVKLLFYINCSCQQ